MFSLSHVKQNIEQLLAHADVKVNGTRRWDIQVHDPRFYEHVWGQQSLGLGESYMDGWWDCSHVDEFLVRIVHAKIHEVVKTSPRLIADNFLHKFFNFQTKFLAKEVAKKHYNLDNNLFEKMLDKEMAYSCGYWEHASNLDEAQQNKLKLICQKLQLSSGMRLLDIGCGWGSLVKYAAQHYGVEVVGITISEEQKKLAEERCKGLPVKIKLQDYRDVNGQYDRIASVGMFEHVGYKNYRTFMEVAHRCLKEDGLFLLHTIGGNKSHESGDPWLSKYIFPHGMLPSISQVGRALEGLFVMEDWHNFGADYDKTLMAWHRNFNAHWTEIEKDYDTRFYRMWNYYLLSCAAVFRSRFLQLWQVVLSKNGVPGGYHFRYE